MIYTRLYYVINHELMELDQDLIEATGNKVIYLYKIVDNQPNDFGTIDSTYSENTEEAIKDFLIDEGHKPDDFKLSEL